MSRPPKRNPAGRLTKQERGVVKALLADGWRNQDIQDLINKGRKATINSARVTEVKQDRKIKEASEQELQLYLLKKRSWDPETGLNLLDDERLIRAREAMILAVQVFNSPSLSFKTEMFAILANVAWTYLLHEYALRNDRIIEYKNGRYVSLGKMLKWPDCPLSKGTKQNLEDLIEIRDTVTHRLLGPSGDRWLTLFQACCLNFDQTITNLFGDALSLKHELAVALQFGKLDFEHATLLHEYAVPPHIKALDQRISERRSQNDLDNLEYQFGVAYTLQKVRPGEAHIRFVKPSAADEADVRQVLVDTRPSDELYPYRPTDVCEKVEEQSGKRLTMHNHTQAWRKHKVRPASNVSELGRTNPLYCHYNSALKTYLYSDAWVDLLTKELEGI